MAQLSETWEKRKQDLKNAFKTTDSAQVEALHEIKNLQIMAFTMYQREAVRLSRILGENHPRVKKINERVNQTLNFVKSLDIKMELAAIHIPEVPKGGMLIHGRIINKNNHGIPGLIVFVEDEKCQLVCAFGSAETDLSGYYAFQIDRLTLEEFTKTNIHLSVQTSAGQVIYRERDSLKLKADSQLVVNITLDSYGLRPAPGSKKTAPTTTSFEENGKYKESGTKG